MDDICFRCNGVIDITQSLVKYHGRVEKIFHADCFELICKRWILLFRRSFHNKTMRTGVVRYTSREHIAPERILG